MKNIRVGIESEFNRLTEVKNQQLENAGVMEYEELKEGSEEQCIYDEATREANLLSELLRRIESVENDFARYYEQFTV